MDKNIKPLSGLGLVLSALLLGGCATTGMSDGHSHGSEIEGQLQDGGWVYNVPGKAHTHHVVLAACPDTPLVAKHVHNSLQAAQIGEGPHKHRACFVCPPKNRAVKRILN
ncbi:MAG: hypothetical protein ACPGSM_14030 [Thiolinea sp.]